MQADFNRHRVATFLLCATVTLILTEGILLLYYLDSWLTLPLL